jgi:hypothetical protein
MPFTGVDRMIIITAALLGMATGFVRARATRLRYDHESGELMAGFSLSALLFLIPIGFARHISREYLGIGPSAVSHGDARAIIGSLTFVLAMVVTHRTTLYRRSRGLCRSATGIDGSPERQHERVMTDTTAPLRLFNSLTRQAGGVSSRPSG